MDTDWREQAEAFVRNYCHVEEIPAGLDYVVAAIARDMAAGDAGSVVSAVTEGDTSVAYALRESLLTDYRAQLQPYRRLGKGRG